MLNLTPTSALKDNIPYTAFFGDKEKTPTINHLQTFGCCAFVHVQKDKRATFKAKTRECIFVGYPLDGKGWRVYDPLTKEIFISRDMKFDKDVFPGFNLKQHTPEWVPKERKDNNNNQPGPVGDNSGLGGPDDGPGGPAPDFQNFGGFYNFHPPQDHHPPPPPC